MTGEWKEYKFQSIIPVHYDENGNITTHEYMGYKCSRCGYENGNKKSNYCPDCARKKGLNWYVFVRYDELPHKYKCECCGREYYENEDE